MPIQISGVQLGNITGGPSSLNLYDLADVSIVAPQTGQYLRYNNTIQEWQNSFINGEVYSYLDTNLTGSNGVVLTKVSGPQTVDIGLEITTSGDVSGDLTAGDIAITLATVNSNVGTFGSGTAIPVVTVNAKGLITAVSTAAFTGTSPLATSLAGGSAGSLPYQSGANVTTFLSAGTTSQVLVGGASAPSWSNTPTLTGTNFVSIPNAALVNDSVTIGTTEIDLGASSTTLAGLTSVTSTAFVGTLTGSATTLATARDISITGDASWTVSFNGSNNVTSALTLATVNGSPQSDTFRKITVNGKGLTTATSAVSPSDITTALAYTPVDRAGDTMTGFLILNADPVNALGAVTKQYVDTVAAGLNVHASCVTATTVTLASSSGGTVTYNNGAAGVGATLTTTGSYATIGGYSTADGNRILVKNEATQANNGIYVRTSATVLTRAADFDDSPDGEIEAGDFTFITGGTLAGSNWVQITPSPITVGSTSIVFTQLSGPGTYVGGTGIDITSNTISNTGVTSAVAGANIAVSGATGAVTFSVTGTVPSATTATTATNATQIGGSPATDVMLYRGSVLAANQDTATGNGFYQQDDGGSSSGLLVFTPPGSSLGPAQMRLNYPGTFEFRNKTDNTTWTAWKTVLSNINYNSYSPTLTGTGASGTWGINITGNAVTLGGLALSAGVNNGINQVVRTDSSGYIQAGWINTISGDNGVTAPTRIYASSDAYIRYYTPANFKSVLNLPSTNASNSWTSTNFFLSNYDTGVGTSPPLQAYSSGGAGQGAVMAFHRSGAYAVNMGLDSDNIFRLGGWSAPANLLQVSMTGEFTPLGNYNVANYGLGMTGIYDSTKYQAVFSMGLAYRPSADGTSLSNQYGISWTHTNVGGQSKAGLSHQALFVTAGVTQTAIGTGIWTAGNITLGTTNALIYLPDGNYLRQNTATYGSFEAGGTKGGYAGVYFPNGGGSTTGMFDGSGNGGDYDTTAGWHYYWNRANLCLGIGGSVTASGYKAYTNGAHYVAGKLDAISNTTGVSTGITIQNGDLTAYRTGGTSGVVYLSNSGTKYLYYDATNFQLQGGGLVCSGDITAFSDIRVKKNIEVIPDALNKVLQIRGVTFNRTDQGDDTTRHAGVIAQEVEKVLPEVVTESSEGPNGEAAGIKKVAYGNMVGLLIEAIKELNAKVESLQAEVIALRA